MSKIFERYAGSRSGWDDPADREPRARAIAWDLIITTAGFAMTIAAVLLTLRSLSVG